MELSEYERFAAWVLTAGVFFAFGWTMARAFYKRAALDVKMMQMTDGKVKIDTGYSGCARDIPFVPEHDYFKSQGYTN